MPKNMSLYNALKKQYGSRADEIYARMEAEGKAPFQKGLKTAKAHGHLKGGK